LTYFFETDVKHLVMHATVIPFFPASLFIPVHQQFASTLVTTVGQLTLSGCEVHYNLDPQLVSDPLTRHFVQHGPGRNRHKQKQGRTLYPGDTDEQ
jgi:hypothetical protein